MFKSWFGKRSEKQPAETDAAGEPREGPSPAPAEKPRGAWSLFKLGLAKTRAGLKSLLGLRGKLDEEAIERIESELFAADFGPAMVQELIDGEEGLRCAWKAGRIESPAQVLEFLKSQLKTRLRRQDQGLAQAESGPTVLTSVAKLAHHLRQEGKSVLLAAADTFRAAAVEQLTIWSQRLGIEIVTGKPGADPASVAYAGAQRALEEGVDCLIVDTAGRLHTDKNLMRELQKVRTVLGKKIPGAPHESLLVLDSTNGQNAIAQAEAFQRDVEISGIILTKLDGTAKGGAVFAIHQRLEIPVKLIGIGEQLKDLERFEVESFVEALFESEAPA
jgi:fused signal recognition particle receptor